MAEDQNFKTLEKELEPYKQVLAKASDTILDKEVSHYPIFVVHQQIVDIGIPLIEREAVKGNWSVNASSLEEFVGKQIIHPDKVDAFKSVFKDPTKDLCLFVLSELGANFVFIPRNGSGG